MAYAQKVKTKTLNKDTTKSSDVPYSDEVKSFANPHTKEIMWIKRDYLGKGWYATYVNGKLLEKSRNPKSSYEIVPQNFKEISLFSEMNYHSGLNEKGKITNYGTNDYTLQYSDYNPKGVYKFQSPLKSGNKKEFGKVKNEVELQEWNYVVLDWKPVGNTSKLQIKHNIYSPFEKEKNIYTSREYDLSEKKQAISDFKDYVKKIQEKK